MAECYEGCFVCKKNPPKRVLKAPCAFREQGVQCWWLVLISSLRFQCVQFPYAWPVRRGTGLSQLYQSVHQVCLFTNKQTIPYNLTILDNPTVQWEKFLKKFGIEGAAPPFFPLQRSATPPTYFPDSLLTRWSLSLDASQSPVFAGFLSY